MILYTTVTNKATAEKFGLVVQEKSGWQSGVLNSDTYFIHATNTPPVKVKTFGLSPEHASEYLMDTDGNQLGEGKMVFAMTADSSDKIVWFFWKNLQHRYKFKAPAGTKYYSQNGTITKNKEVAFPYIIEASDIVEGLA